MLLLFAIIATIAWQRKELWFYFVITAYAVIFENVNMFVSQGKPGSYFYHEALAPVVIETPLFVILSWPIIVYGAYILAQALTKKFWAQALTVPLLAVIIDFLMDPVAARMGLWTWVGYGGNDGILGVPLANFMGWYFVVFAFMFALWIVNHIDFLGRIGKYIIIPIFGFALFITIFGLFGAIAANSGINQFNELIYFALFFLPIAAISVALWFLCPGKIKISKSEYIWILISRLLFYVYGLTGLYLFNLWSEPLFWALIIFAFAVEIIANIKFFKNAKT